MTILHVIEPFASGVTTFLVHLTNALPHHQHVVVHGGRTRVDTADRVKQRFSKHVSFISWPYVQREISLISDLRALLALVKIIRTTSADVIHLHSSKAGFIGRVACFLLHKRSVVYTPHAAAFLRRDVSRLKRKFFAMLETLGDCFGGVIIACCTSEQEAFRKEGINTLCINNGLPANDKRNRNEKTPAVVTAGLITEQKNPALFNKIAEAQRDITFTWAGDGTLRHHLTSENITVTGWQSPETVNYQLAHAAIYLSTSAWEGMPYAVLEAMEAGCCMVLSDTGGHRDVVQHGINGFLFTEAAEAIQIISRLLATPDQLIMAGAAAQRRVADFSAERMAEAYEFIYYQTLP